MAVTLALPAAVAQSSAALTAEEAAELSPILPLPPGGSDEPLASLAPKLVLAIAAERMQLQPVATVAAAGQRVPFTLTMAAVRPGQVGPYRFIVEQWRVDGIAGGNASVGSVAAQAVPGAAAGEAVAQAQATYLAPARLAATREVTVSATVRIGRQARHRIEVMARVLLLAGPVAGTVTWDTRFENLQGGTQNRGSGASVDNESNSAITRHRHSGALSFAGSGLATAELGTGQRLGLYAQAGFAQAQAMFFNSGWRQKKDAWCSEDSSYVQAASGDARRAWGSADGAAAPALSAEYKALLDSLPESERETMHQALAGGPKPDTPQLLLQLVDGALRAQFSPPTLRIESTLEDASTYVRQCPKGNGTNANQSDATQRAWSHGATNVGISTSVHLQRHNDGTWQWAGSLPNPINTATFRQDTSYRIIVRTK